MSAAHKPWLYLTTAEFWPLFEMGKPELARMILKGLELHTEEDDLIRELLTGNFLEHFLDPSSPCRAELPPEVCYDWKLELRELAAGLVIHFIGQDPGKWMDVVRPSLVKTVFNYYGSKEGGPSLRALWKDNHEVLHQLWRKKGPHTFDTEYARVCYRAHAWNELSLRTLWEAGPDVYFDLNAEYSLGLLPVDMNTLQSRILQVHAKNQSYHECMYLLQVLQHPRGRRVLASANILLSP